MLGTVCSPSPCGARVAGGFRPLPGAPSGPRSLPQAQAACAEQRVGRQPGVPAWGLASPGVRGHTSFPGVSSLSASGVSVLSVSSAMLKRVFFFFLLFNSEGHPFTWAGVSESA